MPTFANNYKVEIYSAISAVFIKYNAPDEIKEFLQEDFRSQSKFDDLDDIPETDVDLTTFDRLRFGPNGSVTFDQVWRAFIEHYYLMFKVKSTIRYENNELAKEDLRDKDGHIIVNEGDVQEFGGLAISTLIASVQDAFAKVGQDEFKTGFASFFARALLFFSYATLAVVPLVANVFTEEQKAAATKFKHCVLGCIGEDLDIFVGCASTTMECFEYLIAPLVQWSLGSNAITSREIFNSPELCAIVHNIFAKSSYNNVDISDTAREDANKLDQTQFERACGDFFQLAFSNARRRVFDIVKRNGVTVYKGMDKIEPVLVEMLDRNVLAGVVMDESKIFIDDEDEGMDKGQKSEEKDQEAEEFGEDGDDNSSEFEPSDEEDEGYDSQISVGKKRGRNGSSVTKKNRKVAKR